MNKQLVQQVTATQIRQDLPEFSTGDTVRVSVKIRENNKERQQVFEGIAISIRGSGVSKSFTVRKSSAGVGVERTFLLNSPNIVFIEVSKHGKVRRKKLYYLRKRQGKRAKVKEVLMGEEQKKALEAQRNLSKQASAKQAEKTAAAKAVVKEAVKPAKASAAAKPEVSQPAEKPAAEAKAAPAEKPESK